MTNPLTMDRPASSGGNGPMNPGDIRTVVAKDPKTGEIIKTIHIRRTAGDYVYDLCDAYNAARTRDDIEWFVANGTLHLGAPNAWTARRTKIMEANAETRRDRWKAAQDDNSNQGE